MTSDDLNAMSLKQLERLQAECFQDSIRYDQVTPILEAKSRRAESKRTWTIAAIASAIALLSNS